MGQTDALARLVRDWLEAAKREREIAKDRATWSFENGRVSAFEQLLPYIEDK